jgi:pyridinium-3,5-bisthiocarboxylic acid mononucleotide nickel chelatase
MTIHMTMTIHHDHTDHQHTHDHDHSHNHDHNHDHNHEHRNLHAIWHIIYDSALSDVVKDRSYAIFMEVAKAEAKVHGKDINEVHFHEVGAIDSIVDIVGSAICLEALEVDKVMASTIQLGGGFVKCAHGLIPVPAPATVEILKGAPVATGRVQKETTTPTGAAILAATVDAYSDTIDFVIDKVGYGLGTRDLEIPNVLRAYLGHVEDRQETSKNVMAKAEDKAEEKAIPKIHQREKNIMIEANIDDMNGELFAYVEEALFEAGARDVFKTAIMMKKGRPAVTLSVLSSEESLETLMDIILRETTSLGVRYYEVQKVMLDRIFETIETPYGTVTLKKGLLQGEVIKVKPEYEDCMRLAKEKGVSLQTIYKIVNKLMEDK